MDQLHTVLAFVDSVTWGLDTYYENSGEKLAMDRAPMTKEHENMGANSLRVRREGRNVLAVPDKNLVLESRQELKRVVLDLLGNHQFQPVGQERQA